MVADSHQPAAEHQGTLAETLVDIAGHLSFGPPKTRAVRSVPIPRFVAEDLALSASTNVAMTVLQFLCSLVDPDCRTTCTADAESLVDRSCSPG